MCYTAFECGECFPRECDAKLDFACVCLQVISSAGAVPQLKLAVEIMIHLSRVLNKLIQKLVIHGFYLFI